MVKNTAQSEIAITTKSKPNTFSTPYVESTAINVIVAHISQQFRRVQITWLSVETALILRISQPRSTRHGKVINIISLQNRQYHDITRALNQWHNHKRTMASSDGTICIANSEPRSNLKLHCLQSMISTALALYESQYCVMISKTSLNSQRSSENRQTKRIKKREATAGNRQGKHMNRAQFRHFTSRCTQFDQQTIMKQTTTL